MKKVLLNSAVLLSLAYAHLQAQTPAATPQQQTGPLAPGAAPAGFEGSAYRKTAEIPARILNFTALPSSIQPGQPAVLDWATENHQRSDDRTRHRARPGKRERANHSAQNNHVHADRAGTEQRRSALRTDEEKIGEFICENNRDYRPLFGK